MNKPELKNKIRTIIKNGCGDNSCEFKKPSVGTDGGCRCLDRIIELCRGKL